MAIPTTANAALARVSGAIVAEWLHQHDGKDRHESGDDRPPEIRPETAFTRLCFDVCVPMAENENWPRRNGHIGWQPDHTVKDFLDQFAFE